jgi:hypothetical protein
MPVTVQLGKPDARHCVQAAAQCMGSSPGTSSLRCGSALHRGILRAHAAAAYLLSLREGVLDVDLVVLLDGIEQLVGLSVQAASVQAASGAAAARLSTLVWTGYQNMMQACSIVRHLPVAATWTSGLIYHACTTNVPRFHQRHRRNVSLFLW